LRGRGRMQRRVWCRFRWLGRWVLVFLGRSLAVLLWALVVLVRI
jgi:hypothetical protein